MPDPYVGWLRKKGQFIPSIKRRFFVLEAGIISYYKDDVTISADDQSEGNNESRKLRLNSTSTRRLPKPLGKVLFDSVIHVLISCVDRQV